MTYAKCGKFAKHIGIEKDNYKPARFSESPEFTGSAIINNISFDDLKEIIEDKYGAIRWGEDNGLTIGYPAQEIEVIFKK